MKLRRILVPAALALALAAPALQATLDLGLSASEFAGDGEATLRAASYAFSIWSLIYAALAAYAIWQALPRQRDDQWLDRIAGPAAIAIAGCGVWIIVSSADWKWTSVVVILGSAAAAITAVARGSRDAPPSRLHRWLALWPLALLAGWLTTASALNLLTVATARGLIDASIAAGAALAGILAVVVTAAAVLWRTRVAIYGLPIAWGLVAVGVAEQAGKPAISMAAFGAAGVVAIMALLALRGRGASTPAPGLEAHGAR